MGYRYINDLVSKENLQYFLELVDLAAGGGKDVNNVFALSNKLNPSPQMKLCIEAIQRHPASAKMLEERYVGPIFDLTTLLTMPKHSLGWTYGTVMSTLGYDVDFYPIPPEFNNDAEYINYRVYKTHDIHHMMTGFSLNNFGELGVISVMAGQTAFPTFLFLDLLGLLFGFFKAEKLYTEDLEPQAKSKTLKYKFDIISLGIGIAQEAKPLFPVKWEEELEKPIEELRQELNIQPIREGVYSWYSNPTIQAALA